ncbi:MAG: NAD-dependent epimerase/dehydratase family protein [Calditrichaeota bacterium]|nr:MAG: NAD-dependent epimerase/dehydratase family protein [Calditrichota bacterium]
MLKRSFDVLLACTGLLLFLPFFPLVMLLIKCDSRGPIFMKQLSVGKDGQTFMLYRFRTVVADAMNGSFGYIRRGDSRLTRLGRVLEFFRIDHFPELFNVLKGNMSVFGPTPEVPAIVSLYRPKERRVLRIRPGLLCPTSLFEQNGWDEYPENPEEHRKYYIENVLHRKLEQELRYAKYVCFKQDLKLVKDGFVRLVTRKIQDSLVKDIKSVSFILPHDIALVTISYVLAYLLRFEWTIPKNELQTLEIGLIVLVPLRILVFTYYRFYKKLWRYLGVSDILTIVKACTVSSVLFAATVLFLGFNEHSRSVFLIDWVLCISLVGGFRMLLRFFSEHLKEKAKPLRYVFIVGAGDVGEMLLRQLNKTSRDRYRVMGFLDDNPSKLGLDIHGVKVLGSTNDLTELVPLYHVDEVIIAISNISSEKIKKIARLCERAGVKHKFVPEVHDLLSGKFNISKIREVEITDLFGRQAIELDISGIREFLSGKRILVTGAGGSIGSELCRQIAEYNPRSMYLVDKNENYLHDIQCELEGKNGNIEVVARLVDISNKANLRKFFEAYQPEIVFHAAAQKHVPLGETNPEHVIQNNVLGTKLVVDFADAYKVRHFVLISTDKAVNPTSLMGVSKRLAEIYTQAVARESKTNFNIVRFGNVLNSNGSAVPLFMKQIANGGPVTVTHPAIERYFMSISEAVQLILQALIMGHGGQIFVLNMGRSIRIIDLAKELIRQSGLRPYKDVQIKIVGLRPGEKLFEELIGKNETLQPTEHSSIKVLQSSFACERAWLAQQIRELLRIAYRQNTASLRQRIQEIVPEYAPVSPDKSVQVLNNRKPSLSRPSRGQAKLAVGT